MKLLTTPTANPKIAKGLKFNYANYILHLAPANLSGYETCAKRTAGCTAACLNTAGRGGMFKKGESTNIIQQARIRKTKSFFENRAQFMADLVADIELAIKQSAKKNLVPVIRLNGTSDLAFEKYSVVRNGVTYTNIFAAFDNIQFYDYTAILGRKVANIKNYHLTFSAKESNSVDVTRAINQGYNVAMVFDKLPDSFMGLKVIDADESDLRFLDSQLAGGQVICGLKAKGPARKDTSGFVRRVIELKLAA
jgi:hypothetical protein